MFKSSIIKLILLLTALAFLSGCTMWDKYLADSTHYCTHEKDGKVKGPFPVKLKAGMDTVWQEDGWKITCVPIEPTNEPPKTDKAVFHDQRFEMVRALIPKLE